MNPFVCLNPYNTGEWWEISGNCRRLVSNSQKSLLQYLGANPTALAADWFVSYPISNG